MLTRLWMCLVLVSLAVGTDQTFNNKLDYLLHHIANKHLLQGTDIYDRPINGLPMVSNEIPLSLIVQIEESGKATRSLKKEMP